MLVLDASGIRALNDLRQRCARAGTALILEGIHAQPLAALEQAELLHAFGPEHLAAGLDEALDVAQQALSAKAAARRP